MLSLSQKNHRDYNYSLVYAINNQYNNILKEEANHNTDNTGL